MNSFVFPKLARRVFVGLAAVASVFLTMGCGSGNSIVHPLGGSFSNASLNGTYVMKQTGFFADPSGNPQAFSEATIFTANGSGSLTVLEDDGGPQGPGPESLAGSYSIGKDGTGSLIFNNPTTSTYEITMIDDSHFYVIEGDVYATSAGSGVLQTSTAAPSGTFAFKSHLVGTSSRVGAITIAGGTFAGTQDLLDLGGTSVSQAITGTVTAPNANGVGNLTLTGGISFNYYPVSSAEFFFMSSTGSLEIGLAETQTATTLAAGTYVFGGRGDTLINGPDGIHSAGVFTTDGSGHITASTVASVDYEQDGNVQSGLTITSGTYTVTGNGRGTINLSLSNSTTLSLVFWIVSPTRAYFLSNNPATIEDGTFTLQSGATTTLSGQATFVMDGFDSSFKDRVGVFVSTSSTAFNWNQASNAFSNGAVILGTNGTYTVGSNGRVTATVNGVTTSVVFYLSSPNSGYMVQEDGADIGGVFLQQASQ
jgi:hypothetical protein